MKLNLSPITCDLDNEFEKGFADWYSTNRALTKELVLLGYSSFAFGAARYYQEHYAKTQSAHWKEATQKLGALEREKQELVASIERGVQERVTAALAFKERDIERLTQHIDSLTQELDITRHQQADVHRAQRQQLEASFQEQMALAQRELQLQVRQQLDDSRAEIERLKHEAALCELQATAQQADKLAALAADATRYKQLYEDARDSVNARMDALIKSTYEPQLAQLQQQLAILRKSNAGKGVLGEATIATYLRHHFPAHELRDTGKIKHSCDIHLKSPSTSAFVAVESKYKETITRQDVDKFLTDVEYMTTTQGASFRAAAFISVRTRNIPGKGELHLEFHKNKPLIYIGLPSEDAIAPDDPFVSRCIRILLLLGDHMASSADTSSSSSSLPDVLAKIHPLLKNIASTRKHLATVKDANKRIVDSVSDMEKELTEMFETLHDLVGHMPAHNHKPT